MQKLSLRAGAYSALILLLSSCVSGLSPEQIPQSTHALHGSYLEADLVSNDESSWTGSAYVIEKLPNNTLLLITSKSLLKLDQLANADVDGKPEIKHYSLQIKFQNHKTRHAIRFAPQVGTLDAALLEVDASGLVENQDYIIIPHGSTLPELKVGDPVVAVGAPPGLDSHQTPGQITAIANTLSGNRCQILQTNSPTSTNNLGGPLFLIQNNSHLLLGINSAPHPDAPQTGLALALPDVLRCDFNWYAANADGATSAVSTLYPK